MTSPFHIDLTETKTTLEASFGDFPFWQGVQDQSGIMKAFSFRLSASIGAPIRQTSGEQVLREMVEHYGSDAYGFMTPPPGFGNWADELGDHMVNDTIRLLTALPNFRPQTILEVGGGTTYMAKQLKKELHADRYVLIDPAAREATEGIEVIRDYYPHASLTEKTFDLVVSYNTLEHVPDPLAFLRNLRQGVSDRGYVVLMYPDCERQLRTGDLNVLIHEHLSYLTVASTRSLIAAAGFRLEKLESVNDTFAVVLAPVSFAANDSGPLDERSLLRESIAQFQNNMERITGVVTTELEKKHRIGFHGATNALNIFLFRTGLGNHPNIFIYDGDQNKTGKFLSASGRRIMGTTDPSYAENDLLIVSAMSYFTPIQQAAIERYHFHPDRILPMSAERSA